MTPDPTLKGASLRIVEQFDSLQGEGALVGVPSRFIRVSGCNLRCHWCDTPESSWEPSGPRIDLATLVESCAQGPRHVVLTGGEPLLFGACATLIRTLRAQGHHVTIETAGTRWLEDLEWDLLSLSPKLAHSTPWEKAPSLAQRHEEARFPVEILKRFVDAGKWQMKFVVRTQSKAQLDADVQEVQEALAVLGVSASDFHRVYLMPECTDQERLTQAYLALVPVCMEQGFSLGQRMQVQLWGHCPGT